MTVKDKVTETIEYLVKFRATVDDELDDFISAADFVDVMSVELKAIKTFISMWEEIEE